MHATLRHAAFIVATLSLSLTLTQLVSLANSPSAKIAPLVLEETTGFDKSYSVEGPPSPFDCTADYIGTLPPGSGVIPDGDCDASNGGAACGYCDQDIISNTGITATPSDNGALEQLVECGAANQGTCQYAADSDSYICQGRPTGQNCTYLGVGVPQGIGP